MGKIINPLNIQENRIKQVKKMNKTIQALKMKIKKTQTEGILEI